MSGLRGAPGRVGTAAGLRASGGRPRACAAAAPGRQQGEGLPDGRTQLVPPPPLPSPPPPRPGARTRP
jgi:hypothetical protein